MTQLSSFGPNLFYFSSSILVLFVVNQLLVSMEMSYAFNLFLFEAKKSLKQLYLLPVGLNRSLFGIKLPVYLCITSLVKLPAFFKISQSHCDHFVVFVHSEGLLPRWLRARKPFLFCQLHALIRRKTQQKLMPKMLKWDQISIYAQNIILQKKSCNSLQC